MAGSDVVAYSGDLLAYGYLEYYDHPIFFYRRLGSPTDVQQPGIPLDAVGSVLTYEFNGSVHRLDTATESDTNFGGVSGDRNSGSAQYIGNTGDGILVCPAPSDQSQGALCSGDATPTNVVKRVAGAPDRKVFTLPANAWIGRGGVDGSGFVYFSRGSGTKTSTIHYVDFASRTDHIVASFRGDESWAGNGALDRPLVALTPSNVVWVGSDDVTTTVYRAPRMGGGTVVKHTVGPTGISGLAATDSATAYPTLRNVVLFPAGGGPETVVAGSAQPITSNETQLVLASNGWAPPPGVYTVDDAGTAKRVAAVAAKPTYTAGIALTAGRIAYADDRLAGWPVWNRPLTDQTSSLALGDETAIAGRNDTGAEVVASGNRTAVVTGGSVQIYGGHDKVTRVRRETGRVQLSGPRLLMTNVSGNDWEVYSEDTGVMIDLRTGHRTVVPPNASIWGPYLVYGDLSGTVWRLNLEAPTSSTNPLRIARPTGYGYDFYFVAATEVWGDWVGWRLMNSPIMTLKNVRTGQRVKAPADTNEQGDLYTVGGLTDGAYVNWRMRAIDLRHPTQPQIQLPRQSTTYANYGASAVDERLVAWVDADGRTKVARLPFNSTTPPHLLYGSQGEVYDHWNAEFDTTKQLASWRLAIRSASGSLIRVFTGDSAPTGAVNVLWDGKNATGHTVPSGLYRWTFTGSATDGSGSVTAADGRSAARGRITYSRTPFTRITAGSPLTAIRTSTPKLRLHWRSRPAAKVKAYQVSWQATRPPALIRSAGLTHRWITTTATAATFGSNGHPTRVVPGRTYYFSARLIDPNGVTGRWSTPIGITAPYDDSSYQLKYSPGWTLITGLANHYRSTAHETTLPGKSLTLTTAGRQIWLIGDKGPTGGSFKVHLDGGYTATVSTYAPRVTHRAVLYHARFRMLRMDPNEMLARVGFPMPLVSPTHELRILTNGASLHPWVSIDAIAVDG